MSGTSEKDTGRIRLVYRPNHPAANENGMINANLLQPSAADPHLYVISDTMEPTRHMVTGKYHTSKSAFRAETKAAGCVEIGNDSSLYKERKRIPLDKAKRREDIQRTIYNLRNGR